MLTPFSHIWKNAFQATFFHIKSAPGICMPGAQYCGFKGQVTRFPQGCRWIRGSMILLRTCVRCLRLQL